MTQTATNTRTHTTYHLYIESCASHEAEKVFAEFRRDGYTYSGYTSSAGGVKDLELIGAIPLADNRLIELSRTLTSYGRPGMEIIEVTSSPQGNERSRRFLLGVKKNDLVGVTNAEHGLKIKGLVNER